MPMNSLNFRKHFAIYLSLSFALLAPLAQKAASAAESAPYSFSGQKWGLGVASAGDFTGGTSSLTALLKLSGEDAIQFHFTIPSTSPFQITAGGIYKHVIAESQNAALHLGGGAMLGSLQNDFALSVAGVLGLSFHFSDIPRVQFHLDGGPMVTVLNGDTNFSVGALSSFLGLSVLYML